MTSIQKSHDIAATFADLDKNIIYLLIKNTYPELTDKEINAVINNVKGTPLFVTDMLDIVNNTIHSFNLQDYMWRSEIGRGSFGTVNSFTNSNSTIAFKEIENISDLMCEIGSYAILTATGSQNTPKLIGFNLNSNNLGFAIELASTDLYKWVQQFPNPDEPRYEEMEAEKEIYYPKILDFLLKSLGEIQACGIIHGDIKAHNILLWLHNGNPTKAAITDFSLASSVPHTNLYNDEYKSPEVWDNKPSSFASDCWAFGMSIIYMCTKILYTSYYDLKNKPPQDRYTDQLAKYLLPNQVDLINRMLSWAPEDRCIKKPTIKVIRNFPLNNHFKIAKLSSSTLAMATDIAFRLGEVDELYEFGCLYIAQLWCENYPQTRLKLQSETYPNSKWTIKQSKQVVLDILKRLHGLIYIPGFE